METSKAEAGSSATVGATPLLAMSKPKTPRAFVRRGPANGAAALGTVQRAALPVPEVSWFG